VDLDQPLLPKIKIGKHTQPILYESIAGLCFECGCIGHKSNNCPNKKAPIGTMDCDFEAAATSMPSQTIAADEPKEVEGFGPWMVVSRRKNRGNGNIHRDKTLNNQGNSKNVKGSGPNKGSVAGPSSHNTRRGKEVGLGQPNNTKPPTPKTKVQISTDINAVESDKRDSSPHPRALSPDTLAESSKIPEVTTLPMEKSHLLPQPGFVNSLVREISEAFPHSKEISKQKISPPKNGPSKGERNSSTSLSSGRLLLDRTRSAVISDVQIEDFPHLLIPPPTETETSMTESFKNQLLADLVDQEFREAREIAVAEVATPTADPWVTHLMKRIIFTPDLPFVKTIVIPKFVKETRVIAQSYIERVTNQMEYNVVVLPHHHEEANMIWKMTDGTVTAVPEIAKWWLGSGNPTPSDMKILIWNCRGAANSEFKRVFTDL
ncbi:Zinc finger, CCHC-type, partial [Corchorus capsularis]